MKRIPLTVLVLQKGPYFTNGTPKNEKDTKNAEE